MNEQLWWEKMPWFFLEPFMWALLFCGLIWGSIYVPQEGPANELMLMLAGAIAPRIRTRNGETKTVA